MMSRVKKGLVAGFAATIAVSLLEIANQMLGPWASSFPRLLSFMVGMQDTPAVGWALHFAAGTLILGPLFGILCPRLPTDTPESKGILFAVSAYVVMGLTVAPMANIGVFGLRAGFVTLAWMILTHAVYGIVLGNVYGRLVARDKRAPITVGAPAH